jgi:NADH-quinone oxidoreductase subunit C
MSEHLETTVKAIQDRFDAQVKLFRGEYTLIIQPEKIVAVASVLRDEFGFNMLMDITAVDYFPKETPRYEVIYQLYSMPFNVRVQLRVPVDHLVSKLDTVETVFPVANWKEREVYDLFGIVFNNHSDLRRVVMPSDWVGHPLRKDYPLGYEEVQFSFNFDEIMKNKPQPKD